MIWQILFRFLVVVVLVFGVIGFAVGVGLVASSARTFRFMHAMNRWVSTRGAFKPLDVPRDTGHLGRKYRRWVGAFLIAGGLVAVFGLLTRYNASAIATLFAKGAMRPLAAIVAETARWVLIVGSVSGVAVGLLLCWAPNALGRFEKHADKWVSTRQVIRGEDDMHLTLDRLVEAHPKRSGWIFICTALCVVAYSGVLLFTRA